MKDILYQPKHLTDVHLTAILQKTLVTLFNLYAVLTYFIYFIALFCGGFFVLFFVCILIVLRKRRAVMSSIVVRN